MTHRKPIGARGSSDYGSECRGGFRGPRRASRRKMQPPGVQDGEEMLPEGFELIP